MNNELKIELAGHIYDAAMDPKMWQYVLDRLLTSLQADVPSRLIVPTQPKWTVMKTVT